MIPAGETAPSLPGRGLHLTSGALKGPAAEPREDPAHSDSSSGRVAPLKHFSELVRGSAASAASPVHAASRKRLGCLWGAEPGGQMFSRILCS